MAIYSDGEIANENDQDSNNHNHLCKFCKKRFVSGEKLASHEMKHCGNSHKCLVCRVAYSVESRVKGRTNVDADTSQCDPLYSMGSSFSQGLEEVPVAAQDESRASMVLRDGQGIDCVLCGETFGVLQHMLQHIHSYETFPCTFCDNEYLSMRDLGWHCKDKHDLLVVRCPFCSRGFREYSHLVFHMREHRGHLCCKVCKVQCLSRTSFDVHMDLHKRDVTFQGEDVEDQDEKETTESVACIDQQEEKKQVCHICSKFFNSFYSIFHHMRKEHPKESIPSYNQDLMKRRFICKKCGFAFRRKDTLERHEGVHKRGDYPRRKPPSRPVAMPKPGNLLCTVCGRAFLRMTNLEAHMEKAHPNACDDVVKNKKKFCCDQCGKLLMSQKSLDRHIQVHQEPKFSCPICNKKLKHQETLKTHLRTHTGEKPYSCHECNQAFAQRSTYVQHMCIHTGERPHRCEVCNKTFIRKTELRMHEAKHSNLRLFPCSFCSKTFKTEKHRKVHETQLHSTRAQTYVCEKCGKSFTWASGLKAHACSHAGEAPYKCKECNKAFSQPLFLKRHMQVHNKPFKCEHCYVGFKAGSDLRNHLTQAHGTGLTNQVQSLLPNQFQTAIPDQSWKATKVMMEIGLDPSAPLATQLGGPLLQGTVQASLPNQGQGCLQNQLQLPHTGQAHAPLSGQVNVPLPNMLSGQPHQQFLPDSLIHDRSMFMDSQFQVQDSTNQAIAAMLTQMSTL